MYMFVYVCFQWWTWYLFLGQCHGSDWWLVLLSDRRAVNTSSSKVNPYGSVMLKLERFYLKNLQLFQSDLLILSSGFRQVNRFQNQARIWIHTYNTHNIYKLKEQVCQKFSKPTVYYRIHHKHTPVPMNSTSYCPSTASTLSTRRRVSL